jgi:hypothetical protein
MIESKIRKIGGECAWIAGYEFSGKSLQWRLRYSRKGLLLLG